MRTRTQAATAAVGLMVLVLAGCGNTGSPPADQPAAAAADTATSDTATGGDAMAAGTVAIATTDLGDVLVGAGGMTLYMYDPDKQGDSTCYNRCATSWPPLLVDGDPVAGAGVDATLLGTTERTDGTTQVTYDGWPLYYWAQDAAAGDVTGQAVNGVWWVLKASGEPIRD